MTWQFFKVLGYLATTLQADRKRFGERPQEPETVRFAISAEVAHDTLPGSYGATHTEKQNSHLGSYGTTHTEKQNSHWGSGRVSAQQTGGFPTPVPGIAIPWARSTKTV